MNRHVIEEPDFIEVALGLVPPLVVSALLEDESRNSMYQTVSDATIDIAKGERKVRRTVLFSAVQRLLADGLETTLNDTMGRSWRLTLESDEDDLPRIVVSSKNMRSALPDLAVMSSDVHVRLRSFERASTRLKLPISLRERWNGILELKSLDGDEVGELFREIQNTPFYVSERIREVVEAGHGDLQSLVPNSERYFERLVGVYDDSETVIEYASNSGREAVRQLSALNAADRLLFGLLLSSHASLSQELSLAGIEPDAILEVYELLAQSGDVLSQVGAIEIALRELHEHSELEQITVRIIERIVSDEPETQGSRFNLFASLFVMVDGELSRRRLFSERPPFYRRMASLAHAALIQRQIVQSRIDVDQFSSWAFEINHRHFLMQNLADMRLEPRWSPDFALPIQIKEDFLGRVMIAARNHRSHIRQGELHDAIFGEQATSLKKLSNLRQYYAGPLEGVAETPMKLPIELSQIIEEQLDTVDGADSNYTALVHLGAVYQVEPKHVDMTIRSIRLARHRLLTVATKEHLIAILNGIASVAAVSRSTELANEVRVIVRRYLHESQPLFTAVDAMRVCIIASAANTDFTSWQNGVGDWLSEISLGELTVNESRILLSYLDALNHAIPQLWIATAKTDAALKARMLS